MWRIFGIAVAGIALVAGCSAGGLGDDPGTDTPANGDGTATAAGNDATTGNTSGTADKALTGDWRVISAVLYYDNGRNTKDVKITLPTRRLTVGADGKWQFGSSSGTWTIGTIEDADLVGWGIKAYGPTRKITLNGWSGDTCKGPIEESTGPVDFFWVIYRYTSDTSGPGTVWMKFGKDF